MVSLQKNLRLSDTQLTAFIADFKSRLPKYLQEALQPLTVAAQIAILLAETLNYQGTRTILGMGSFS